MNMKTKFVELDNRINTLELNIYSDIHYGTSILLDKKRYKIETVLKALLDYFQLEMHEEPYKNFIREKEHNENE